MHNKHEIQRDQAASWSLWTPSPKLSYCHTDTSSVPCFLVPVRLRSKCNSLNPRTKIAEFPNSVDLDEVAHNEPPHLDLHCLPFSL